MSNALKVFIDGQHGTTGLQIREKLEHHTHVQVIEIATEARKDVNARKALMNEADIVFLCLPDAASKEIAADLYQMDTRVIDASSAHRVDNKWTYGLPELRTEQRTLIKNAKYVSNPGCYATGAILLLNPLSEQGLLPASTAIHINGYSGYSGGGTAMINAYESSAVPSALAVYGLDFNHKHIAEIMKYSQLQRRPTFIPSVVPIRQGMIVLVAFDKTELNGTTQDIKQLYQTKYQGERFVQVKEHDLEQDKFLHISNLGGSNNCEIYVFESADQSQVMVSARLDNLGKGASSAAIQNMNIMLGLDEGLGIN
ncbi:MAG: N-acetyl-gamma-glutamyl-phosphate reductase [Thiofilum sp.]|uniref:N-acetyl-gamma-glutamyl-phosphate reductase n=1 Tax=Thiofilum sp. TaxID=2212733 RepID=UPI0025F76B4D|nr:N-acetyl-gamma-glutamyl-phosphate reductase [Thiofilum sp.]MBK8452267.1 N-acetyl-gamma-glutamyl-phosphate reductase [Thiofilum sp.]